MNKLAMLAFNKKVGGGGGASSWNDLTDKPFYETSETTTEEMTIEWDGVIGDRIVVKTMEHPYIPAGTCAVRVSDALLPSRELMSDSYMTVGTQMGETVEDSSLSTLFKDFDGGTEGNGFFSIYEDDAVCDNDTSMFYSTTFPKKGLYFLYAPGIMEVSKVTGVFTLTKTEIKKIDEKFLPKGSSGGVSSWNDLTDKPFYTKLKDPINLEYNLDDFVDASSLIGLPSLELPNYAGYVHCLNDLLTTEQLAKIKIHYSNKTNGVENEIIVSLKDEQITTYENGIIEVMPYMLIIPQDNMLVSEGALAGSTFSKAGVWFIAIDATIETQTMVTTPKKIEFEPKIKTLNLEYLPKHEHNQYTLNDDFLTFKNTTIPNTYATKNSLSSYATVSSLSSYAKNDSVDNAIKLNKSFYKSKKEFGWDGIIGDRYSASGAITNYSGTLVYINDFYPSTVEEISNYKIYKTTSTGANQIVSVSEVKQLSGRISIANGDIIFVEEDNVCDLRKKGTYFKSKEAYYISRLILPNNEKEQFFTKISSDYLSKRDWDDIVNKPFDLKDPLGVDTIEWDGIIGDKPFYNWYNTIYLCIEEKHYPRTLDELEGAIVYYKNRTDESVTEELLTRDKLV